MACGWFVDLLGQGGTCAIAGAAVDAAGNVWLESLANVLKVLMTFWLEVDDPNLADGPGTAIDTIRQITLPVIAFSGIIGMIVAGIRLMTSDQEPKTIARGLLLLVTVGTGGTTVVALLIAGFDGLAHWVLDAGFDGQSIGARLALFVATDPGLGTPVLIIITLLGILASLIQVVIVFVRGVILALLCAILPMASAAAMTNTGMDWLKKIIGWIAAFTVYKLAAAIIYATGFAMIGNGESSTDTLMGLSLLVLAVVALPALLRLLPPAVATSGGGGGLAALAGAALATGSILATSKTPSASGSIGGSGAPALTGGPGMGSSGSGSAGGATPPTGGPSGSGPTGGAAAGNTGAAGASNVKAGAGAGDVSGAVATNSAPGPGGGTGGSGGAPTGEGNGAVNGSADPTNPPSSAGSGTDSTATAAGSTASATNSAPSTGVPGSTTGNESTGGGPSQDSHPVDPAATNDGPGLVAGPGSNRATGSARTAPRGQQAARITAQAAQAADREAQRSTRQGDQQ